MLFFLKNKAGGLCFIVLLLWGCGSSSGEGESAGYRANLVFPEDISRLAEKDDIDCAAAGIATIRFNFIVEGRPHSQQAFDCDEHNAHISDPPTGTGITVEVFADDAGGNALLDGAEVVDILPDRLTTGGEIKMRYIPPESIIPEEDRFTNTFGMEFFRIPAAGRTFQMGSPSDELGRDDYETQHEVTLTDDFYVQATEVTQGQWRAVVAAAGRDTELNDDPSLFGGCENCPVEQVSWEDVHDFIDALNQMGEGTYALPTEAQWEFAARGGTASALPNGALTYTQCELDPRLDLISWYCGNSNNTTHPVRSKRPNDYGLYDMLGNVWEWCEDRYGIYPETAQTNPQGPSEGTYRVLRGGSWNLIAGVCRSATRGRNTPSLASPNNGFRLIYRSSGR